VVATDTGVPDMNSFASFLDLEPFAAAAQACGCLDICAMRACGAWSGIWNHFDYSRRYGAIGVLNFNLNAGWRVTVVWVGVGVVLDGVGYLVVKELMPLILRYCVVWLDRATIRFRVFGPSSFNTALQLVLRPHFLVHFV
jgi:hypothetical protein